MPTWYFDDYEAGDVCLGLGAGFCMPAKPNDSYMSEELPRISPDALKYLMEKETK